MRLSAQLGGGRCRKSRDRIFELTKSANGYKIYGQHVCVRNSAPQANFNADMAELADAQDLESCGQQCRFDSCYPHGKTLEFSRVFFIVLHFVLQKGIYVAVEQRADYSPPREGGQPKAGFSKGKVIDLYLFL